MIDERDRDAERTRQWAEVMAWFGRWLEADADGRAALLGGLAAQNGALHARVVAAIETDRDAESLHFLEHGALAAAARASDAEPALRDRLGERIGPWRVVRLLGVGGMGQVWLVERSDGLHAGQAALKMLRFAALDRAAQQRFAREGELLARLRHPHVARLLDVGESGAGQRYLVIEYVDGERIDDWCDARRATVETRLRLFEQVCAAIAYAHGNLIVHRDLKPSNILVEADGTAKVLDFGMAKLLEGDGPEGEVTELTRAAGAAFTPEYAAPEQFSGDAVTVATDVYSLGAVLYVLLTGRRPHGEHGATPIQLAHAVSRDEPRRPSARIVATTGDTHEIAGARSATPKQLQRILRGDLDTILAKALKKDPQERYASVQAFAEDIRRYLGHRPIAARADSAAYRLRKYVRRHRIGVAVGALSVLAILGGLAGTLWQAHEARLQAAEAAAQAKRAESSQGFLIKLMNDLSPFSPQHAGKPDALSVLDNAIKHIDRDFADSPQTQFELRHSIAQMLATQGDLARAREICKANIDAARKLPDLPGWRLGGILADYGQYSRRVGDPAAARAAFAEAEPLLRDAQGVDARREHISLMTDIARLDAQEGNYRAAQAVHEAVLRERQALDGAESPDMAMDLMSLAGDAFFSDRVAEAETLAQRAHDMLIKLLGPAHARRIYVDNMLGLTQVNAGHAQAAVETLKPVVAMAHAILLPNADMTATVTENLGAAQFDAGDVETGLATLRDGWRIASATADPTRGQILWVLGRDELAVGKPEALATLSEARELLATTPGGNNGLLELVQAAHGATLARTGKIAEGEAEATAALERYRGGKYTRASREGMIELYLADIREMNHDAAGARALREAALQIYLRIYGGAHPYTIALERQLARK